MDRDGVMVGANDAKIGEKRRFGNLTVGSLKGEEAEGRERRGGQSYHGRRFLLEERFMTSISVPTFCASI